MILPRSFYARDAETVARDLLGMALVHTVDGVRRAGRIVETEAYLGPQDLAAHSSKGRTRRTEVMFGPPGYAYVYLIYGMHHCLNAVTGQVGDGSAVLLRALEPLENIEGKTSGPGLLCRALGIDLRLYGADLLGDILHIERPPGRSPVEIASSPRVGVAYAGDWAARPLRFYIPGNRFVSRAR
jgi:DNA-3-methyladenine glycosylase